MPCSLPRWIGSVLLGSISALPRRVSSPTALAFPYRTDGRHPRYSFRGLLELHWRYGLQICSPTFGGLGCEAPMKSVTKLHRSSAIQAYRDLLARDFHPLVIRAVRAHVLSQIAGPPGSTQARPLEQRRRSGGLPANEGVRLRQDSPGRLCAVVGKLKFSGQAADRALFPLNSATLPSSSRFFDQIVKSVQKRLDLSGLTSGKRHEALRETERRRYLCVL